MERVPWGRLLSCQSSARWEERSRRPRCESGNHQAVGATARGLVSLELQGKELVHQQHTLSCLCSPVALCWPPHTHPQIVLSSDEEAFGGYRNATKDNDVTFRATQGNHDNRPYWIQVREMGGRAGTGGGGRKGAERVGMGQGVQGHGEGAGTQGATQTDQDNGFYWIQMQQGASGVGAEVA